MMDRRLRLAKRLLRPDGVLIVTIDEHEVHHLGMLLESIFPTHLRHMITIIINPKGTGKLNFGRVVAPKGDAPEPADDGQQGGQVRLKMLASGAPQAVR